MSGSIRLTGVNGLPLGGSGLRYPGVYAALDFANNVYELGGVSRRALTALPGFTFTRASLAMGYDATGKLVYGPNNLLVNSVFAGGGAAPTSYAQVFSTGTSAPTASTVYGGETAYAQTATAQRPLFAQASITFATNTNYNITITIEAVTGGLIASDMLRLASGPAGSVTVFPICSANPSGGGTGVLVPGTLVMRTEVAGTAGTTSVYIGIGCAGGATGTVRFSRPQLEAVTYQTTPSTYYPTTSAAYYGPRLVYDPVTLASLGILVEEARTNLCLQSQAFDNASWLLNGATISANATTSPDGTSNADTLVEDTSTGNHYARQLITTTAAAHTFSVYVKAAGRSYVMLFDNTVSIAQVFNLTNGTVGGNAGVGAPTAASIQSVGNGWYRCSMTLTTTAASNDFRIYSCLDGTTVPYTGNGTASLYLFGAQLELGQGASSPIPTTTAAVTRAADNVILSGLSLPAPYSAVSEFNIPRTASGVDIVNWGSLANGAGQYVVTSGQAWVRESSSTVASVNGGTVTANTPQKMASRFETNNINNSINGGIGTADTSATVPAIATLGLGPAQVSFGGIYPNGTISRIRIYNRALTDAQLQSLTS